MGFSKGFSGQFAMGERGPYSPNPFFHALLLIVDVCKYYISKTIKGMANYMVPNCQQYTTLYSSSIHLWALTAVFLTIQDRNPIFLRESM